MTQLSVNLNKVALVRNARGGDRPDVTAFGEICLAAGAAGLTLHPRPDERHALTSDVLALADLTRAHGKEMNVEGNPFEEPRGGYPGFMEIIRTSRPVQATLVPDVPGQRTSDHGWELPRNTERLRPLIDALHDLGCRVSLFVDANVKTVEAAANTGADRVELYTGPYAEAHTEGAPALEPYVAAAERAREVGLALNAGHDLNRANLGDFLAAVPWVEEVSIGQALVSDALEMGMETAVRAYIDVIQTAYNAN